jgi:hypothetical protein
MSKRVAKAAAIPLMRFGAGLLLTFGGRSTQEGSKEL